MKNKRILFALVLLLTLTFAQNERAQAFEYLGAAWCCDTVKFCLGEGTEGSIAADKICGIPSTSWFGAVSSAIATWNNENTAFQLAQGGATPLSGCDPDALDSCRFTPTQDGQNTISVASDCALPNGFLAVAMVWTNVATCCITEADICFNSFQGQSDFWYLGITPQQCVPQVGCFDVETVALHELGHWSGLGHEDDNIGGVKQVMHSATGICDFRRTLTADDQAGLQFIHGSNTVIQLSQRCNFIHTHPAYAASGQVPMQGGCGFPACYGTCVMPPGTDFDGDGFCDDVDNCPDVWNRDQIDTDGDTWGDSCDCAPNNSAINPGAIELCSNGVDDDCNGFTDGADPACATGCCVVAGDFNHDGAFNIADVTAGIARIFAGGPAPFCNDEADTNGDNAFNIADVTYGIARIFGGGPAPVCGTTGT
jgi:Putative metal-binding motif